MIAFAPRTVHLIPLSFSRRPITVFLSHHETSLSWVLQHPALMLGLTILTICINVYLFTVIPKGFFPGQDTGRLNGSVQASQDISFQAMSQKLTQVVDIVMADPAVDTVGAFTGGGGSTTNTTRMFIALKSLSDRKVSADQVIARLRGKLANEVGASTFLRPV